MNIDNVEQLRSKKLIEYKTNRFAELEDRRDTLKYILEVELKKLDEIEEQIGKMKFIPSEEGSCSPYNY